ncbi:importin-11 [Eurytemora carolleeae]|uniref:importin-11 n=1 Tax=Eurytemora carolleeae TaxID=1294199 RepID=UPI000C7955DB|nr:importin-11 [Eurytemora carolleeae]|eukprot:XP_023328884.1 importin-11-like [Eurytemora affinis]
MAVELVLSSLQNAGSQDPLAIRQAEEQLRQWEIEPGFYTILMNTFTDYSIDANIRWQAVVYFKNGVDKYWRTNAPNAISEEEKVGPPPPGSYINDFADKIRSRFLRSFSEPENKIAVQVAVSISKAARFDVPRAWPDLLPALSEAVQSQDNTVQHRGLLYLHHTIKALASKRLAVDRRAFLDLTNNIIGYLLNLWHGLHQTLLEMLRVGEEGSNLALAKSILAIKVLRRLVVQGLKRPQDNTEAMMFVDKLFDEAKNLLQARKNINCVLREPMEKYIVLHQKIWADLLESHPYAFVSHIRKSLTFICSLCFTDDGRGLMFQRFIIFCFNILKGILVCMEYKPPKNMIDTKEEATLEAHALKSEFFQLNTVTEICRRLISDYLLMTKEDLELWGEDPEEFACEETGDSWKYCWRPCCEAVFVTVFHEYRESLAPVLVDMVRSSQTLLDPTNLPAILQKDAVYAAVGHAAFDLYDEIDFDSWLTSSLGQELDVKDSNYRIIRRRVCWLLGQWSGVKLSPGLRPRLYQLLLPLLAEEEDLVVRLAAAKALKVVIDDFEFSIEELEPYLAQVFSLLFNLLKEVNECDTKLNVLNVLSYFIERVGVGIRPICSSLLHYLPILWEESSRHDMLRCAILTTLVFIVQGLGTVSEGLLPFLAPVLDLSTDLTQESHIYLLEDGLELWLTVLHNTAKPYNELVNLLPRIPPLLEMGSENLRTTIYIIQAYVLLCPSQVMETVGPAIVAECAKMYPELVDDGRLMILRLVESWIRCGPPNTTQVLEPLLLIVVEAVHTGEDYPVLMSLHLSILSRLILISHSLFSQLCLTAATLINSNHNDVAGKVLDVWCDKMACVTAPERRKLLSLALASLLTTESPVVLSRVYMVFLNIAETLNDVTRPDDSGAIVDSLMAGQGDAVLDTDDIDYETEHDSRKRHVAMQDPVHTVVLKDYVQSQVQQMAQQLGETNYKEIIMNVDVETRDNLLEFLTL